MCHSFINDERCVNRENLPLYKDEPEILYEGTICNALYLEHTIHFGYCLFVLLFVTMVVFIIGTGYSVLTGDVSAGFGVAAVCTAVFHGLVSLMVSLRRLN